MKPARWMCAVLWAGAVYNILWGIFVVCFPNVMFERMKMAAPNYPQFWQCIGMIVGVYGVGYAIAATNPLRHWPIVLVGLLGKILGPIGFLAASSRDQVPWRFGITIITNDLIWWIPFALILRAAYRSRFIATQDAPAATGISPLR